jgi:hypothetical protein
VVSGNDASMQSNSDNEREVEHHLDAGQDEMDEYCKPIGTHFDINGPFPSMPNIVLDEEDRQPTNLAAKMICYHQRFGHISFQQLGEMTKQGIIPHRLVKYPILFCSACLYAKASKWPW